jgi:hypothetical protein
MDNMDIWDFGAETAPSAVKTAHIDGRIQSSINGTYMAKKATEKFGPIGSGWGYDIVEERYDNAGPIFDDEGELLCQAQNHTIKLCLWYQPIVDPKIEGQKAMRCGPFKVYQYGHTRYIYKSKFGFSVDSEAPKKSLTDAMKKCLSLLGFSADIFLGEFENQEYVQAQRDKEEIAKAEDKAEVKTRQEMEYKKWVEDTVRLMRESTGLTMLEGLFKTGVRKAQAHKDKATIRLFTEVKDEVFQSLQIHIEDQT